MRELFFLIVGMLLFVSNDMVFANDYEAQLGHQLPRLSSALGEVAKTNNEVVLEFRCLSKSKEYAEAMVKDRVSDGATFEEGEWLAYRYKVSLNQRVHLQEIDIRQWIRTQFFLGVSYHCHMDSISVL